MSEYTNTTKLMTDLTNKVLEGSIVTAKYEQYQRVIVPYDLNKVKDYWVKWGKLYIQVDDDGALVEYDMGTFNDADDFKRPAETTIEESNGGEYDELEDFWEWSSMSKEEQIELLKSKKENVDYDSDDSTVRAIDYTIDLINDAEKYDKEGLTAKEANVVEEIDFIEEEEPKTNEENILIELQEAEEDYRFKFKNYEGEMEYFDTKEEMDEAIKNISSQMDC